MRKSKIKAVCFFAPYLICFLAFWLIPFLLGGFISLHKYSLSRGNGGFVGFDNYLLLLNKNSLYGQVFLNGIKNTLIFVLISCIPLVAIGLLLALLVLNLPARTRNFFRTLFFISYAVSVTVVAAIFRWLFAGNGGYINSFLVSLKFLSNPIPWLEVQPFAWFSILIATIWWTIGFNMIMFINAINEIDPFLYEAAALDGAGGLRRLIHIILPGIKSVTLFILMNTIIASFNLYGQCMLMTKGGPGQSTQTVIMAIANVVFDRNDLGKGTAMALMTGMVMMAVSLLQFFFTREKKELKAL